MEPPLTPRSLPSWIDQRYGAAWIVGSGADRFWQCFDARCAILSAVQAQPANPQSRSLVLLAESDPVDFLAGCFAAVTHQWDLILANPTWGEREWTQVFQRFYPQVIWGQPTAPSPSISPAPLIKGGQSPASLYHPLSQAAAPGTDESAILIPTGGSTGQLKFVLHTGTTLMAAVHGFRQHFSLTPALTPIHTYCVLPLHHVSGLMQALRSFASGGTLVLQAFRGLEAGDRLIDVPQNWFISLVPTQLQRLLKADADLVPWLAQFHAILLGGAPPWPELIAQARAAQLPLAPTYGMTETAAQIATLHPPAFLAGVTNSGPPLPHVHIRIKPDGDLPAPLLPEPLLPDPLLPTPPNAPTIGQIGIRTPSLGLGVLHADDDSVQPLVDGEGWFYPDDIGTLDAQGRLQIIGRHSHKIITGGENVFPEEVEAAIRATGLVADVAVVGVADHLWGQAIAALVVLSSNSPAQNGLAQNNPDHPTAIAALKAALKPQLSPYKHPKHWLIVPSLPRNAQGKLNRPRTIQQVIATLDDASPPRCQPTKMSINPA